jgi:hypothetical protein
VHYRDGCVDDWKWFKDDDGRKYPLVPIRFVMACSHGHLSDIPWRDFCFRELNCKNRERLYLLEAGTGNDFTQIYVQSESGVHRKLADAYVTVEPGQDTARLSAPLRAKHAATGDAGILLRTSCAHAPKTGQKRGPSE